VVECGEATLLPGLINSHVHLTLSASATILADYFAERDQGLEALTARGVENLRAAISAGVTTVRDCGTLNEVAFALRAAAAADELIGPRVVTCGSGLTTPRGHCHFFSVEVDTVEGLRSAVAEQSRAGADFIKVFATGGHLTPGTDPFAIQYGVEELRAIVQAAHDAGLRVAAHAHAPEGIANAVASGVDEIEHGNFTGPDHVAYDAQRVEQIADMGIVLCPTVGGRPATSTEEREALFALNPRARQIYAWMSETRGNFRRMFDAGVVLTAGNDAGAIPGYGFDNYAMAVGAMADATQFPVGLSALDALRSATSVAAQAYGLSDTGRLAPGMYADLIAVEGNPLERITDLERLRLVARAGRVVVGPTSTVSY
jgi:imidazolonepropionase-like amidohydrolase